MNSKSIEIFWGTGGVGKTTLAASRALFLSRNDKKVLLMTIDPSKRLKQIFDIKDDMVGSIITRNSIDVLIFTPHATFKRMFGNDGNQELDNRIMNIIMRPYGGMNEVMAVFEIQNQLKNSDYDTIILDTPPEKHFIDFVKSSRKINDFFDKKFFEFIKYCSSYVEVKNKNIFHAVAQTGMEKILKYIKMITGERFLDEFLNLILSLYNNRERFVEALDFEKTLQADEMTDWFLVTSTAKKNLKDIVFLCDELKKDFHFKERLIVNKSIKMYFTDWAVEEGDALGEVKRSMEEGEERLIRLAKASFENVRVFPEVLSPAPQTHIEELSHHWENG